MKRTIKISCALIAASLSIVANVYAQVGDISGVRYPGWIPSDRVAPTLTTLVSYDNAAQQWRYEYQLANGSSAEQPVKSLDLTFNGPATAVLQPSGWWGVVFVGGQGGIPGATFAAEYPETFVATPLGDAPAQPPAAVAPGSSLSGFVIMSPYPPGEARTYIQGYAAVPYLPDDYPEATVAPDDTTNSQRGWSIGPTRYTLVLSDGNRRPAVDGFLAFMNVSPSGSVLHAPAPLAIKFGINGETVNRASFTAVLNGVDVTSSFHPGPSDGADLAAVFAIGSSPLVAGKNVLITSVDGLVPGTTRNATDTDRIVFTVQ
jgi:hypothetical protein